MYFAKLPTVPTAQELMDRAYGKAALIDKPDRDPLFRSRKTERARLEYVGKTLTETLRRVHDAWPSFDNIHPYYKELSEVLVDLPIVRRSLGSVKWAADTIESVGKETLNRMRRAGEIQDILDRKRIAYGRISSVLKDIDAALHILSDAREKLRKLPHIDPTDLTVVIAGYPNVGKSSLISLLTNARPEIAQYPFTTKHASVGHIAYDTTRKEALPLVRASPTRKVQLVDTPGLLDRPEQDRNDVERQASLAIRHLADVIVFLFDPTEQCGYLVEQQQALLAELKRQFPATPFVLVENKADIGHGRGLGIPISAREGIGMAELFAAITHAVKGQELPARLSEFFREGEEG